MGWLGGVIGGGIGAVIGGPFGAILGAALGAGLSGGEDGAASGGFTASHRQQAVFFTAAFSMAAKMAKADGRVCEQEIAVINKVCREAMRMDERTHAFAINIFNQAKDRPESFADFANEFGEMFAHDQRMCGFMLDFLFQIAMADGKLHPREEEFLQQARQAFRIHDSIYASLYQRHVGLSVSSSVAGLEKYYEILGVDSSASDSEVKKAYHKKVAEFHPDKIAGKGLPPEFIKFANEQMVQINEAYDAIMKARKNN